MTRLMPSSLFSILFPDREDPNHKWQYLCRLCGKPTVDSRRQYWCSDRCYWLTQQAVSWEYARHLVLKRDKVCQLCGAKHPTDVHHRTPVRKLHRIAVEAMMKYKPEHRKRAFAVIYTLLFLDVNNLVALCNKCHNLKHAADNRSHRSVFYKVAPTYWGNFWEWAEHDRTVTTLDEYFQEASR